MARHALYGDLVSRDAMALVIAIAAKGLELDFVAETPALSLALAARAGRDEGPYLRTPEGFVLGGLAPILDHLERLHPEPPWRPRRETPVRRACARLLEDWIELWLPIWPERAASVLEGLAAHLERSPFLLGAAPCRPDGSLAAWLEADVLTDGDLRAHVEARAPRLLRYGTSVREAVRARAFAAPGDDAIPVSLLALVRELAHDYHVYLEANCAAWAEGEETLEVDLGLGTMALPAWREIEERRAELALEVGVLPPSTKRAVRQMLEPLGLWRAFTLPQSLCAPELADPRSL